MAVSAYRAERRVVVLHTRHEVILKQSHAMTSWHTLSNIQHAVLAAVVG